MLNFYLQFIKRFPALLWESIQGVEGVIAVVCFAILLLNKPIGQKLMAWKVGINPRWCLVPLAIWFVSLLFASNYERFLVLETAKDDEIGIAVQQQDKESRKNEVLQLQIEQLTIANAALQTGATVLTDAQARIASIREQFLAHADKVPTKGSFTPEAAYEWYVEAQSMCAQTLSSDSELYFMYINKDKVTYEDLLNSVGGFRGIAINITEECLTDTVRDSRN